MPLPSRAPSLPDWYLVTWVGGTIWGKRQTIVQLFGPRFTGPLTKEFRCGLHSADLLRDGGRDPLVERNAILPPGVRLRF